MNELKWDEHGLVPVVVQEYRNNEILMLAWLNKEALKLSLETKKMHYWSRERNKIWMKGETSGNFQEVIGIKADCDNDTLLAKVKQTGNACHTDKYSCFFNTILEEKEKGASVLNELWKVLEARKLNPTKESYTCKLLADENLLLKKINEESAEVVEAKDSKKDLIWEISDLIYHLLVLMLAKDVLPEDIFRELGRRRK